MERCWRAIRTVDAMIGQNLSTAPVGNLCGDRILERRACSVPVDGEYRLAAARTLTGFPLSIIAMGHRNRRPFAERKRFEKRLEVGRRHAARNDSQKRAVRAGNPARDKRGPAFGKLAVDRRDDEDRATLGSYLNCLKKSRSAMLIAGTGQATDELINRPLASNTLRRAISGAALTKALRAWWASSPDICRSNASGVRIPGTVARSVTKFRWIASYIAQLTIEMAGETSRTVF